MALGRPETRSRSPTLRASRDNDYDPEKLPESMQADQDVVRAKEKRRSKGWQDQDQDDPFGDEADGDVKYRTLSWWQCAVIVIAETISLGVLSLPSVLAEIGMIGGAILIVGLGVVATYTGYVLGGHLAFFSFISEMREPKDFTRALIVLQVSDTTVYLIVAMVCYAYAGNEVLSPALGSPGGVLAKIGWGVAIPTIVVAGVIYAHVGSKYVYVRIFRGTRHMSKNTWLSIGTWMGITLTFWVIAWVIAESIPNFNNLLALISSLFASWFTYGLSGIFWLFLNFGGYTKNWKKMALTFVNITLVCIGAFICIAGLYASGTAISGGSGSESGGSWTCASNGQ
ncbi:hypothetical protein LTR64_008168 [Lithohypha guttulata]|uniref:uncharacterized protein n=1 Tax=Lithohypha guttulata TaxID=1690604 RepID=UPI002DDFA2E8|nr:hypothetical protein LTR51_008320 [Lithohypha guttulata]